MATQNEQFQQCLDQLADLDPSKINPRYTGNVELSFDDAIPDFTAIIDSYLQLAILDWALLPPKRIGELIGAAQDKLNFFGNVASFSVEKGSPVQVHQQLLNQARTKREAAFDETWPWLTYLRARGIDSGAVSKKLDEFSTEIQSVLENETEGIRRTVTAALVDLKNAQDHELSAAKETYEQLDQLLESARSATESIGVASHSIAFSEQSEKHRKAARNWFWGTIVVGLIIVLFALLLIGVVRTPLAINITPAVEHVDGLEPTLRLVRDIVVRLVILSVLFGALAWTSRNYKAHRHNQVSNQQKANSLASFEAFVGAARDQDTKNAVLVRTTEAIFGAPSTGYSSDRPDQLTQPRIVEITRATGVGLPGSQP